MNFQFLLSFFLLLFFLQQPPNPLLGKWVFIEGYSSGKPTFVKDLNRIKVFDEKTFYVLNTNNGAEEVSIRGKYNIIDKEHFKEILGKNVEVIYLFHIVNDTLSFEGSLNIPLKNDKFRTVYIKERWLRKI